MSTRYYLLPILALMFASCATRVGLKPADRAAIRSVSVDAEVSLPDPDRVYYYDPALASGGLIPLHNAPGDRLQDVAGSHGISIKKIVRDAFLNALVRDGTFRLTDTAAADARIHVAIGRYGVTQSGGPDRPLRPLVFMGIYMMRGGKMVYQSGATATAAIKNCHTFAEFEAHPEWLRAGWEETARVAAGGIFTDLKKP